LKRPPEAARGSTPRLKTKTVEPIQKPRQERFMLSLLYLYVQQGGWSELKRSKEVDARRGGGSGKV
jgi:hypothetical protein